MYIHTHFFATWIPFRDQNLRFSSLAEDAKSLSLCLSGLATTAQWEQATCGNIHTCRQAASQPGMHACIHTYVYIYIYITTCLFIIYIYITWTILLYIILFDDFPSKKPPWQVLGFLSQLGLMTLQSKTHYLMMMMMMMTMILMMIVVVIVIMMMIYHISRDIPHEIPQ